MVKRGVKEKREAADVFAALREGCSLYAACETAGLTTKEFYEFISGDADGVREYHLALADYADRCTDNIKAIAEGLKAGEIDNSTAKILIETEKWLAQKACPQSFSEKALEREDVSGTNREEIVVRFV